MNFTNQIDQRDSPSQNRAKFEVLKQERASML